jgi:hypothetical protein
MPGVLPVLMMMMVVVVVVMMIKCPASRPHFRGGWGFGGGLIYELIGINRPDAPG